jgi:small-conductance mechanosensitive channel
MTNSRGAAGSVLSAVGTMRPEWVPEFSYRERFLVLYPWQWVALGVVMVVSIALAHVAARLAVALVQKLTVYAPTEADDPMAEVMFAPTRALLALGSLNLLAEYVELPTKAERVFDKVFEFGLIVAVGWAFLRGLDFALDLVIRRGARDGAPEEEDFRKRALRTQLRVTQRIGSVAIIAVTLSLALLQIPAVKNVGVSLLASAGIVGVVLGLAAQKSIGAILAGLQISLAQPIRLGDIVIVDGEYGFIEDLRLTYVVLKTWDERRLIIPTSRFLEQPFQSLTRSDMHLLGAVFLRIDRSIPIAGVRAALDAALADEPLWDKRLAVVHVTDVTDLSTEVRCLVSVARPSDLFQLRANVRERLLTWLQGLDQAGGTPRQRHRVDDAPSFSLKRA